VFVLVLDIPSDQEFIKPNGGHKVSPSPQGFLFVESVLNLNLFLQPSAGFAFYDLHGVGNAVSGCSQKDQVDMVDLDIQFQDFPMFPFADGFKDSPKFTFYFFRSKHLPSVFGSPHQMVLQVIEAM